MRGYKMKFWSLKKLLLIPFLLSSLASYSHIFKIEQWETDTASNSNLNQTVLLFSDIHRSNNKHNQDAIAEQREAIVNFAKQYNAAVIVEDGLIKKGDTALSSSSVSASQELFSKNQLDQIQIKTPLHGLNSLCCINNIKSFNAEFRFCPLRTLSVYYQLLQNKKQQIKYFYKDGPSYENYYADRIEQIEQLIETPLRPIFDLVKKSDQKINEFLNRNDLPVITKINEIIKKVDNNLDINSLNYQDKIETLFIHYENAFLDIELLHALATCSDYPILLICAGDIHIQALREALQQIGYKQINQQGKPLQLTFGNRRIEPAALDINKSIAHFTFSDVFDSSVYPLPTTLLRFAQHAFNPITLLHLW